MAAASAIAMLSRWWPDTDRRPGLLPLVAIMALGAAVRFWALDFGLPHTQTRPDESMIIDVVREFLRGHFRPAFFDYPWFFMYLSAGVQLARACWGQITGQFADLAALVASWPARYEPFFLANRALSATFGTLSIAAAYALGRRVAGRAAGLIGAFFLAICFLHVRDSHYGTTDAAMTFFILLAVVLLIRAEQEGRRGAWACAGAAAGLAAGTKYNALALGVPIVAAQAISLVRRATGPARPRWPALSAGVPFAVVFLLCVPFVYLDWQRFIDAMRLLGDSMRVGQSSHLDLGNGWWYHLRLSLRYGLGLPLLVSGLAGAVLVSRRAGVTGVLLLSFPVAYYAVAGLSRNVFVRYALPVAPFLCVTAAVLVVEAARIATRRRPRLAVPAMAACALLLAAPSMRSVWQFNRILAETDNRVLVKDWVLSEVPEGSSILQSGSHYGHAQLPRDRYRLWVWEKAAQVFLVRGEQATGRPDFILLQESPLPSTTQPLVIELLRSGYQFVRTFHALDVGEAGNIYDIQDAFFVPYAGFHGVDRPGPNFTLYRRGDFVEAATPAQGMQP